MIDLNPFPIENIKRLIDENTAQVFVGRLLKDVTAQRIFDTTPGWEEDTSLELEQHETVLVTIHHDGTSFINFVSYSVPSPYLYRTLIDPDRPGTVELLKEIENV